MQQYHMVPSGLVEPLPGRFYFYVGPAAGGRTVTVGVADDTPLRNWVYVYRGLPLEKVVWEDAEDLYAELVRRGWDIVWNGTRWF